MTLLYEHIEFCVNYCLELICKTFPLMELCSGCGQFMNMVYECHAHTCTEIKFISDEHIIFHHVFSTCLQSFIIVSMPSSAWKVPVVNFLMNCK